MGEHMGFTGTPDYKAWLLVLLIPIVGAILVCPTVLAWHDWQRIVQMLSSITAIAFLFVIGRYAQAPVLLDRRASRLCAVVLVLGGLSAWCSQQPQWAFTEMALMVSVACIALTLAAIRSLGGERVDRLLFFLIVLLCAIKIAQFMGATMSAFWGGVETFDTDLLLSGFSNKRFYGQFQTFTLPLLVLPLLLAGGSGSRRYGIFLLLCSWWLVAISGGTRGTWLGMGTAAGLLLLLGSSGRRWVCWQLVAALVGGLVFWLLFSVLSDFLGFTTVNFAGDRLNSSLSLREIIWQLAWDMIRERPWLGFGPMHFADIANPIAAHPHQAVLQWASEWGVPSALCVAWLVLRGLFATIRLIREKADSQEPADLLRLCLFASLVGALTQSMVDGVIVMPYSQLWLALVVGWLLGLHRWRTEPAAVGSALRWSGRFVSMAAVALLVWVVIRDVPNLPTRDEAFARDFGGHFQPRFWAQGVIAQKHP